MIRKTERIYKNYQRTFFKKSKSVYKETHLVSIKRITYWFLFVPIFSKEEILSTNM
jgi:hypothetical protein